MSTETQKVDAQRSIAYASGVLVVYEGTGEGRRVVARIPNKGYPQQATQHAREIAAIPKMLRALHASEKLLDSVAFVTAEGDTDKPLALIRAALARMEVSHG